MYSILFLTAVSFAACLVLTPFVRRASHRLGVIDHPSARKLHGAPIPRTGGVAIAGACLIAIGALMMLPLNAVRTVDLPLALKLLPAAGLIFTIGLMDDVRGLRAWEKLLIEIIAACLVDSSGVQVLALGDWIIPGWWSLPLTVIWLVGCANAYNLIDGVDGLATGVGVFATFTVMAAALLTNNAPLALATAPLLGALLAFLRYNFNPASIFLGDSGSLTIGFVLGCFGAIWSQKSATLLGMTAPLMALSVPLLDTGAAVVRRFIRRQPIFSPDRNHLHHRLLDRGFSHRKVALIVYGACGLAAAFSLLQTIPENRFNGVLLLAFSAVAWIGIQFVGYAEFDVARSLVLSGTFRDIMHARMFVEAFERRLKVATTPRDYWQVVREANRQLGFGHVRMSMCGLLFEDRPDDHDDSRCCAIRIPLPNVGYVNFGFGSEKSARDAIAITALVDILQRTITVRARDAASELVPALLEDTETIPPALTGERERLA